MWTLIFLFSGGSERGIHWHVRRTIPESGKHFYKLSPSGVFEVILRMFLTFVCFSSNFSVQFETIFEWSRSYWSLLFRRTAYTKRSIFHSHKNQNLTHISRPIETWKFCQWYSHSDRCDNLCGNTLVIHRHSLSIWPLGMWGNRYYKSQCEPVSTPEHDLRDVRSFLVKKWLKIHIRNTSKQYERQIIAQSLTGV